MKRVGHILAPMLAALFAGRPKAGGRVAPDPKRWRGKPRPTATHKGPNKSVPSRQQLRHAFRMYCKRNGIPWKGAWQAYRAEQTARDAAQ
jgi:hypothetical protein